MLPRTGFAANDVRVRFHLINDRNLADRTVLACGGH